MTLAGDDGRGVMTAPVTVVIPVFNRRDFLARALRSVMAQSVQPSGVVVVDDGSTDGSAELAEQFGVQVVRQNNAGSSGARNVGIERARTPWIALLDSDDQWFPHHLETLFSVSEDTVLRSTAAITAGGRLRGSLLSEALRLTCAEQLLWPENPVVTSSVMFDRQQAIALGAFNVSLTYNEDLDLWIRMLSMGAGLVLPRVTLRYEVHGSQLSSNGNAMYNQTRQMLTSARAQGWCSTKTYRRVMAREHWDALRAADRDWGTPRQHASALLHPLSTIALGETLVRRRRGRQLARVLAPQEVEPRAAG